MANCVFRISMFLVCLSFISCARLTKPPLTEFGKKVKKLLKPDENFEKIFATNFDTDKELQEAIIEGSKNLYKILELPSYDEAIVEKIDDDDEKTKKSNINPELLFHCYTYSISKLFKKLEILNDDNIDEIAQKFADELNKNAQNLEKDDHVKKTFLALTTAVGNFYKSQGVTSEADINLANKLYVHELEIWEEKTLV